VAKISNRLGLSERTTRDAAKVLEEIKQYGGSAGKDPMGLAGSVLYLICIKNKENLSQKQLADASGVTEVTIRNRAKELGRKYSEII
jgi:transcription initiation factor TFIIB